MKIYIPIIAILFITHSLSPAQQYAWNQKANVGGLNRQSAVGFSVGHLGYIGTGRNVETQTVLRDFWCYDPTNDSWTQVADFGGAARYAATSFVINDTAYVGCGSISTPGFQPVKDFWKYNQGNNTWIQVADFGGSARYAACAFAIATNGYVGIGYDQLAPLKDDFWEYNSLTDTWTQKANFMGGARQQGVGFAINGFGYLGAGYSSSSLADFYKYDPANDSWSQITDLLTIGTSMTCFVLLNEGYVGTGSVTYPVVNFLNQFWRYTPTTNTWTSITNCSPTPRFNAVAFTIDSAAYCGTGGFQNFTDHDTIDFWAYEPTVGLNDITKEEIYINAYPNPAKDKLNITVNNKELLELILYDISSAKILQQKFINHTTLNIASLSKGIYMYEVRSKKAVIKKGKVVKD